MKRTGVFRKSICLLLGMIMLLSSTGCGNAYVNALTEDEIGQHVHDESCYESSLVCTEEHEHTEACYESVRICGYDDDEQEEVVVVQNPPAVQSEGNPKTVIEQAEDPAQTEDREQDEDPAQGEDLEQGEELTKGKELTQGEDSTQDDILLMSGEQTGTTPLFGAPGVVDQGLIARINDVSSYFTGSEGQVVLRSSLSSTDQTEYADVRIPISCSNPELILPQFVDDGNGNLVYNMTDDGGDNFVLTLVYDGNDPYITYTLGPGDGIYATIKAKVPNGYSENTTPVVFGTPIYSDTFTGNADVKGDTLSFTARFGWEDVKITRDMGTVSIIRDSGGAAKLSNNIEYDISADNSYNKYAVGVIFTASYTLSDSITLPTGVAFPEGSPVLSENGKTVTIGGVTIATFDRAIDADSVSISGSTMSFSYSMDNSTLNAAGDPEENMTAAEIANLRLGVTLYAQNLVVTDANAADGKEITHSAVFDAQPCKGVAEAAHSEGAVATDIIIPDSTLTLTKNNNPGNATTIIDNDTPITYTLTAINSGLTTVTVNISDDIPANTVLTGTPTAGATTSATNISWNNVSLAGGETKTFSFSVKVADGTPNGTKIENQASATYDGDKTVNSGKVTNTYDRSDKLVLTKTTPTVTVHYNDTIPYTISVRNLNSYDSQSHVIVDTLQDGLVLSDEQLSQMEDAYGPDNIDYNRTARTITISNVVVPAGDTVSYTFSATVAKKFVDNDAITNTAAIRALNLQAEAGVHYQARLSNLQVSKTAEEPVRVSDDTYTVDFRVTVKNLGDDTDTLDNPIASTDVMTDGLTPVGAGTATSGTTTAINNKGETVNGTWVRTGDAYPYTYTITWDQLPLIKHGETYWLEYTGEIKPQFENGTFNKIIVGNVAIFDGFSSGVRPVIYPPLELSKVITAVNGDKYETANGLESSEVYAGDHIEYTIVIANAEADTKTGTLTDILPPILGGDFQWEYGVNVSVISSVVSGETTAIPVAPVPAQVQDGKLVWPNVSIAGSNYNSYTIALDFPIGAEFTRAFGIDKDITTNVAEFLPDNGVKVSDFVTHTVKELFIPFNKTADKNSVDAAAELEADKTVVFTLSDFETEHYASTFSVLDNLQDVRNKFDINAVDYGQYTVTNDLGEDVGYKVVLTYDNGTTNTFEIPAGTETATVTGNYATVASIKWEFGDVRSVVIERNPTITAIAKAGAIGKVTNSMFMAYNLNYEVKDVNVTVHNADMFTKTLLDANGNAVNNTDNLPMRTEDYTYEVRYVNPGDDEIDLTDAVFTDTYNALAVEGTSFTVTAEIEPLTGEATDPVLPASQVCEATDNGNTGEKSFEIPFTGGTLKTGDTLVLRYNIKASSMVATDTVTIPEGEAPLKNAITFELGDGTDLGLAESGPYAVEKALYFYLQMSVVGLAMGKADKGVVLKTDIDDYYYQGQFDNYHLPVWTQNMGYDEDTSPFVIFNVTLVNSPKSTVSINTPKNNDLGFPLFGVAIRGNRPNDKQLYPLIPSGDDLKTYDNIFSDDAFNFAAAAGGRPIINKLTGEQLDVLNTAEPEGAGEHQYITNGTGQGLLDYRFDYYYDKVIIPPGKALSTYVGYNIGGTDVTGLKGEVNIEIDEDSLTSGQEFVVPAGTKVYLDRSYDLDIPTFSNNADRNDGTSAPSTHDYYMTDRSIQGGLGRDLRAYAYLVYDDIDLGIEKELYGYIDANEFEDFYTSFQWRDYDTLIRNQLMPLIKPIDNQALKTTDYVVWKITPSTSASSSYVYAFIEDITPAPYFIRCYFDHTVRENLGPEYDTDKYGGQFASVKSEGSANETFIGLIDISAVDDTSVYVITAPRKNSTEQVEFTTYENTATISRYFEKNNVKSIVKGTPIVDENGKILRAEASDTVTIGGKYASQSYKQVTNIKGQTGTSNLETKVVDVQPRENFTYTLNMENKSDFPYENLVLIDRLPEVGDVGALNAQSARGSEFDVGFASSEVQVQVQEEGSQTWTTIPAGNVDVGFKTQDKATGYTMQDWSGETQWGGYSENANSIRIWLNGGYVLNPGAKLKVTFQGKLRDPGKVNGDQIAWNTFGYCYEVKDLTESADPISISAEPTKVGIHIPAAYIFVNKVSGTGVPIDKVEFTIYKTQEDAENKTNAFATMTTDVNGHAKSPALGKTVWYVTETFVPTGYILSTRIYRVDLSKAADDAEVNITGEADGEVVNAKAPVNLTLSKRFAAGAVPPAGTTVKITVKGDFYGTEQTMGVSRDFTLTQCDGVVTQTINNLIPGNEYTITETVKNGTETLSYTYTATVTDSKNAVVTLDDGKFTPINNLRIDLVNDTPEPGELYIKKQVVGPDNGKDFNIVVTGKFSDSEDPTTASSKTITVSKTARPIETETGYPTSDWIEVEGVIAGEQYTFTEPHLDTANYTASYWVDGRNVQGIVLPAAPIRTDVLVSNTRNAAGSLTIVKTVDGAVPTSGEFTVAVRGEAGSFSDDSSKIEQLVTLNAANGYTATLTNLYAGMTYSFAEVGDLTGYVPSFPDLVDDQLKLTVQAATVTVNNSTTVNLTITKEVTGDWGNYLKLFTFNVTLRDKNGALINGDFQYTGGKIIEDNILIPNDGTVTFTNGVGQIKLRHGQSITITGLPLSSQYTVAEAEANTEGYTTRSVAASGRLNQHATAEFTNDRDMITPTGIIMDIWPYALGVALTIAAIAALIIAKRKKKDKGNSFANEEW